MNMSRSSSISRRTDPRAGFTLIEVLAGLFITGLFIMTVLPFVTRLIGTAWSGEANMMTADQWMRASARLSADFGEAVPLSIHQGDKAVPAFRAQSDRVQFVRRSLAGDRTGLQIVTLRIEADSEGEGLVRSASPYSEEAFNSDSADGGEEVALLKTPYHLRFRVDDPKNPNDLPDKVELVVDGGPGDIPFVFSIVARTSPSAAVPTTAGPTVPASQ